jgi:hypothetical protein
MTDNKLTTLDLKGKGINDDENIFEQLKLYADSLIEVSG